MSGWDSIAAPLSPPASPECSDSFVASPSALPLAAASSAPSGWSSVCAPRSVASPGDLPVPDIEDLPLALEHRLASASRKGRPNASLNAALAEARALVCQEGPPGPSIGDPHQPEPLECVVMPRRDHRLCLSKEEVARVRRPLVNGLVPPSPIQFVAQELISHSKSAGVSLDKSSLKFGTALLMGTHVHTASVGIMSEKLGVSPNVYQRKLRRTADCAYHVDRAFRMSLEGACASLRTIGLACYIDAVRYDETPMALTISGDAPQTELSSPGAIVPVSNSSVGGRLSLPSLVSVAMPVKLLNTLSSFGMLLDLPGKFVSIIGSTICSLQALERTTATCVAEAQRRICGVSSFSNRFSAKTRLVCTDSASSNFAAERKLAAERGTWASLTSCCDVHRVASIHNKVFTPFLGSNVTGLIRCALSLRHGPAMSVFRRCMTAEITSTLEILRGYPPPQCTAYRGKVLQLFCRNGPHATTRRLLLAALPNGNWLNSDRVEVYVREDSHNLDPLAIAKVFTSGVIAALCSNRPHLYPRHRWCGADLAVDDLGAMECCHRLLSRTYQRFVNHYAGKPLPSLMHARPFDPGGFEDKQDAGDDLQHGGAPNHDDAGTSSGQPSAATASSDAASWAATNAKDRALAANWLSTNPRGLIVLQRLLMEPLRHLLKQQLDIGSDEWEAKQRMIVARADLAGEPLQRQYRVTIASSLVLESEALVRTRSLYFEPSFWSLLPPECVSVRYRALAFKTISRVGSCIVAMLQHQHLKFPIKMFNLLHNPQLAESYKSTPECLLDPWSKQLLQDHPDLSGPLLQQKLHLHAMLMYTDIFGVECRHATIRRWLTVRGAQTHKMDLTGVSAEWVCQQFRLRSRARSSGLTLKTIVKSKRAQVIAFLCCTICS